MSKKSYYELLNVAKDADAETIKRAFRHLAKTHHPDKGGDPEKFKQLSQAASVLQDPNLRAAYDRHGEAGVEEATAAAAAAAANSGHDMDVRSMMGFNRSGGPHKARVIVKVSATLEELFSGVEKVAAFSWDKPCSSCQRTGCKSGKSAKRCKDCRGSGMVVHLRQLGPGMIQQSAVPCAACSGQGTYISRSDRCPTCHGKYTIKTDEKVMITVSKGAAHNSRLMPTSESLQRLFEDEVVFILEQQAHHPLFERRGPHLVCKQQVSLVQALTGVSIRLKNVDGSTYSLSTSPQNLVVKPGSLFRIPNLGLPKIRNPAPNERGDLFIQIDIEFPTTLSPQIQLILKRCLPDNNINPSPPPAPNSEEGKASVSTAEMTEIQPNEAQRMIQEGITSDGQGHPHPHPHPHPHAHSHHNLHFVHGAGGNADCRTM
jgi:DnaJ homolog subfamily A member 2